MRFKRVYIEISNVCNLKCSFCKPTARAPEVMSLERFKTIVAQIKPYTDFVYFHVKGEPLMHPELEAFLTVAHENGLRVNLTTNGTLFKQRRELLLEHPAVRQLNISLHSFGAHEMEGYLEEAVSFAKAANLRGIYVVLRLWNLDHDNNIDTSGMNAMQYIEGQFKDDTDYPFETPILSQMGGRCSVKIARHTFVGWEQEFRWPSMADPYIGTEGICYGMRHQIAILVDGTVVPCCLDANGEAALGNIFTTPFRTLISTPHANSIKQGFENRIAVLPLCQRCSFRLKFDD